MTRRAAGNAWGPNVLILVENAPIPSDRRVMAEATSLLENGYGVTIICPATRMQPIFENIGGIVVRRFRSRQSKGGAFGQVAEYITALWRTFGLMLDIWRAPGFEVIHACNPPDLFFLLAIPFRVFGVHFVFDQHDLAPELYSALYGKDSGPVMWALKASELLSYRTADAIVTVNESYKRHAIERGADPERVFVVRNGPREGWPLEVEPIPELRLGRTRLVVYMGVMGAQDGVDVLLEAVSVLVHELGERDTTFALVGDGAALADLVQQAHDLDIWEYLDFVGWVRDEEVLSAFLATADACVCPEPSSPLNDHSTFIKVMEYMASGTPVVAFDLPETRVSAGDAAVYAAPGDIAGFARLLLEVLGDEEKREHMRAVALSRIAALRWERQVPALLAAYDMALPEAQVASEPAALS